MNTEEILLYQTRKKFRAEYQIFSPNKFFYNLVFPPKWAIKTLDRRFCRLYRDQYTLFKNGKIVWGKIVQANMLLFQPGQNNHPAAIVFSPHPSFDNNLKELFRVSYELYELKNQIIEHPEMLDLKVFAEAITNETDGLLNIEIPKSIALDKLIYYTTIMVFRKHLPLGYLKSNWFPVLVAPDITRASMILPAKYWSPQLLEIWKQDN